MGLSVIMNNLDKIRHVAFIVSYSETDNEGFLWWKTSFSLLPTGFGHQVLQFSCQTLPIIPIARLERLLLPGLTGNEILNWSALKVMDRRFIQSPSDFFWKRSFLNMI